MTELQTIGTISGSIQNGGWQAEGNIFGDADALDWYLPVKSWLSIYAGGWEALPRLAFSGHLAPREWTKTLQTSTAPWSAFTAQQFLKNGRIQGVFYRNVASSPANDHQIVDMTYADIVNEILGIPGQYGHCNLVQGVWPEGFLQLDIDTANSVLAGEHEVKEGPVWTRLDEMARIEHYLLYVDRFNVLHYIRHPMFGTLPTPVFTLDDAWLLEPLSITPRNTETVGQVRLQGTTPAGQQIAGVYPSSPTAGPVVVEGGFKAASSSQMNTVAERKYLYDNRDVSVKAIIPGAVGCLIDLMDRIAITYQSAVDGVSWTAKKFWIEEITVRVLENFTATTELRLEAESNAS